MQVANALVEASSQLRQRAEIAGLPVLGKGQVRPPEAFIVDDAKQQTKADVRRDCLGGPVGVAEGADVVPAGKMAQGRLLESPRIARRNPVHGWERSEVAKDRLGRCCCASR